MSVTIMEPTPLQEWAMAHQPSEELIYHKGYWTQIMFIRDTIKGVLATTDEDYKSSDERWRVISTHRSKSVELPVFELTLLDGTVFTMRYNFHNWQISVNSPREVDADFLKLFDPDSDTYTQAVYCEGFPHDRVFPVYGKSDKKKFTVTLWGGDYYVFTFFWIMRTWARNGYKR
jgi:hypothetical protein